MPYPLGNYARHVYSSVNVIPAWCCRNQWYRELLNPYSENK